MLNGGMHVIKDSLKPASARFNIYHLHKHQVPINEQSWPNGP